MSETERLHAENARLRAELERTKSALDDANGVLDMYQTAHGEKRERGTRCQHCRPTPMRAK
jgi:hypothetical protein